MNDIELPQGEKPAISFSPEQNKVIDFVLSGKQNLLIQGCAGVGKTAVLKEIVKRLQERGKEVAVSATTGIAAINLPGGRTLHSVLNVGLKGTKRLSPENKELLGNIDVLIVDEVSMLPDYYFQNIYKHIKHIQLVFCGDLLQLPPVQGNYFFTTPSWTAGNFKVMIMEHIFRQDNVTYKKVLNSLRLAKCTENMEKYLNKYSLEAQKHKVTEDTIKLFSTNRKVDNVNAIKMRALKTKEFKCTAVDYISDSFFGPFEKMHDKNASMLLDASASREFSCKVGAKVMITRNMEGGLVNGHRGVVTDIDFEDETISVDIRGVPGIVVIRKFEFDTPLERKTIRRIQFPLRLAFAITVHRSQGMTLENVYVDASNFFAPGMLYVAMSRIKDPEEMAIVGLNNFRSGLIPNKIVNRFLKQVKKEHDTVKSDHVD
jgi:ATP-dependent exoDNAse (exonuclease V) alpha subunit